MDTRSEAQGRGSLWRRHLLGEGPTSKIFSAWAGKLDESNQRVIRADAERTRSDMEFFRQPALRDKMEAMLTCWCQERQIKYKQGLNEVLAPFLYLQAPEHQDLHETPSDDEVFDLFVTFVRDYTPFFSSDEFVPLQCAFVFFRRLLLYHRPDLHNLFVEKDVTPDMFCMPWFLTLFASKTPMRLAIQLWDRLLERGEPYFIIFLAAAVLVLAEKEILTADRSALPEILTSLGVNSREDLESLWGCAEVLFMQTPATFLKRVRRVVLKADEAKVAPGQKLLESLEKEGCFFILPEEVLGHCYPTRPGEELRPWQPSPYCPWRLLLLDLRPVAEFEAERLPAAVHLDLASLLPQPQAWASGRKLLQWGKDSAERAVLQPSQVFEVFKETLGEDWICDSQAHICLLGRSEDSALVRHLYKVLTQDLTLRHISVASGGFEAVMKSATKHGYEIVRSEPGIAGALDRQPVPAAAAAAEGAAAAAAAAAETAASKLSAVLSSLKRVTAGPRPASEPSLAKSDASSGNRPMSTGSTAAPAVIDRPGNWPEAIDLGRLPRRTDEELSALRWRWSCVALAIRPPEDVEAAHREGQCGCSVILFIQNAMVVCALPISNDAAVLTEFSVHRVTKVTSKKSSPQTVTLFQEERSGEQVQTTLLAALYFLKGTKEVEQFVSVLQSQRQHAPRPQKVATVTKDEKMHSPLSPPPVALEAAAAAVAAAAGEGAPGEQEGSCQHEEAADADQPTSREQQEPAASSGSDAPDSDREEQTSADPPDCAEQEQAGAAPADSGEENLQDPTHADPADCGEQDVQEQARADVPDCLEQEEQADSADSCDEEQADADPPGDAVQEK